MLLITGPVAVSMALLKRWLRAPWALRESPLAFFTTFVYRQEVLFGEVFGAYVALGFVGFALVRMVLPQTPTCSRPSWPMFVFNGVVGTWALMRLNLDVNLTACLLAFAALAALPGFALVSLRQAAAVDGLGGVRRPTPSAFRTTRSACAAGAPERRAATACGSNRPCGLTTSPWRSSPGRGHQ